MTLKYQLKKKGTCSGQVVQQLQHIQKKTKDYDKEGFPFFPMHDMAPKQKTFEVTNGPY